MNDRLASRLFEHVSHGVFLGRRKWNAVLFLAFCVAEFAGQPALAADSARPEAASNAGAAAKADPMDWPFWRGPEYNGISRERNLPAEWDRNGKNLVWKNPDLGSRSTPIVMNGKIYLLRRSEPGTPREGEKVVCADAKTGEILWENGFSMFLCEVPAERIGWSSVVGDPETGRVYAMAVNNYFMCLDGETGETLWSYALAEEFGMLNTYGGRTNFPVIFEDLVIINGVIIGWGDHGRPVHTFLAFDKMTGELVWSNGTRELPYDTTYSTPVFAVLGGQAAMVFGSGDGAVWAFQPRTGEHMWKYQLSRMGLNVTPVVEGDTVYMAHSEENPEDNTMGAVVAINGVGKGDITKTGEVWRVKEWMAGKSSPIVVGDRLYVADDSGGLFVINKNNGELIGRQKLAGTVMRASLLYADNKIYACTTSAWHVLEPTDNGVKVVHRMRFPLAEEIHATPIVSHGRIYLTTVDAMYCIAAPDAEPAIDEAPPKPQEEPIGAGAEPAHVQVVPAEKLLKPGEKVQYKARLFNERGQFLKEVDAKYSVEGSGKIDDNGVYVADANAGFIAATVKAEADGVAGTARLRVIPELPWKFDFSDQQIPAAWIGIQHRHVPREIDGEPLLVKVTTIRNGTRSQGILGRVDMHDYTVQADVLGKRGAGLPDIGLIAQRYILEIMGKSQQMIVRTWTPQPERFSAVVPVEWKEDVWYTLKFQASNKDDRVVLRGKVWPRGEPEPEEWTLEAEDHAPNRNGAPGLFGNATFGEIWLDNISVTANE